MGSGSAVIVMSKALLVGQIPFEVYVIVYGPPMVLEARSISPVDELIMRPGVLVKVPPAKPVITGDGFGADWQ